MDNSIIPTVTSDAPVVSEVTPVDPWKALKREFQAVRLLKDATRLLDIRNSAEKMKVDLLSDKSSLKEQAQRASDPLERLSSAQKVREIDAKISRIDDGIKSINARATELAKVLAPQA